MRNSDKIAQKLLAICIEQHLRLHEAGSSTSNLVGTLNRTSHPFRFVSLQWVLNPASFTGTLILDLVDFRGKGFRNGLQNGLIKTPYNRQKHRTGFW
jgi:hypothetical protein